MFFGSCECFEGPRQPGNKNALYLNTNISNGFTFETQMLTKNLDKTAHFIPNISPFMIP